MKNLFCFHMKWKIVIIVFLIISSISVFLWIASYQVLETWLFTELQERSKNLAKMWAYTLDKDKMKVLADKIVNKTYDKDKIYYTDEYLYLNKQLNYIRDVAPELILFAYIFYPTEDEKVVKNFIDSDIINDLKIIKEWWTPPYEPSYFDGDYEISDFPLMIEAFKTKQNVVENELTYDDIYGVHSFSAYAPVIGDDGEFLWLLWIDISSEKFKNFVWKSWNLIVINSAIAILIWFIFAYILYFAFIRITNLVKIKKELEGANEELKELDKKKTEFINIASHELRTPMTTLRWYLTLLVDWDYWSFDKEIKDVFGIMYKNTNILLNMINDMLDLTKLEDGKAFLNKEDISLKDLLEKSYEMNKKQAEEKKMILKTICPDKDILINTDKDKFLKVIDILVSNAIKFTLTDWKIDLYFEIIEDNKVKIWVKDNWIGIEEKDFETIFAKFWQIEDHNVRNNEWSGLWLPIAKLITKSLWSELKFKSKLKEWSDFYVEMERWKTKD